MNKIFLAATIAAALFPGIADADIIGEDDDRKIHHASACEKDSRYTGNVERLTSGIRVMGDPTRNVRLICPVVKDDLDGGNRSVAMVVWSGPQTTRISCALSARDYRSFLRWQHTTNTPGGGSTSAVESPDWRAALSIECSIPYSSATSVTRLHAYLIQERD